MMKRQQLILHCAVEAGDLEEVRSLLEAGASIQEQDEWGLTPLHVAATLETPAMAALLLDKSADVHARENHDMSPLVMAAWYGRVAVARLLLERGAADNPVDLQRAVRVATTDNGEAVIPVLQEFGAKIGLVEAMCLGDDEAVSRRLAQEVDLDRIDDGSTLLMHAVAASLSRYPLNFVPLLLERGASSNARSSNGLTPLMTAANWGHIGVVNQLLEHGADPNLHGPDGQTALSMAQHDPEHNAMTIERLRQAGAIE